MAGYKYEHKVLSSIIHPVNNIECSFKTLTEWLVVTVSKPDSTFSSDGYKVIPLCSVPPPRSGDQCGPPLLGGFERLRKLQSWLKLWKVYIFIKPRRHTVWVSLRPNAFGDDLRRRTPLAVRDPWWSTEDSQHSHTCSCRRPFHMEGLTQVHPVGGHMPERCGWTWPDTGSHIRHWCHIPSQRSSPISNPR
jgi:hypothetical protein